MFMHGLHAIVDDGAAPEAILRSGDTNTEALLRGVIGMVEEAHVPGASSKHLRTCSEQAVPLAFLATVKQGVCVVSSVLHCECTSLCQLRATLRAYM
jgi:hypothetical protein